MFACSRGLLAAHATQPAVWRGCGACWGARPHAVGPVSLGRSPAHGWDLSGALGEICFTACAWTTVCLRQRCLRAGGLQSPCWVTRRDSSSQGWTKIPHRSFPLLACEHLLAPSLAEQSMATTERFGVPLARALGVRTRGAAGSACAQPVLVSQGSAVPAPVTAQAQIDGQLSYHRPEGKQGQREGKAPLSSIPSSILQTTSSQLAPRIC